MWLARIFSSLCLLRTNAGKPQNEKRGRGKNTEYPIQGKMLLPRKVISWIHRAHAWLSGSLPPEKQQGQIFQSRLSFPSFPIHLRHKLIYSFIQNLFTFQESVIRKPVCSAVPYVPRSGCRSAPWHGTRTSQPYPHSWRKQRSLYAYQPTSLILRLLNCRTTDKWQRLQPNFECHFPHLAPAAQTVWALFLWRTKEQSEQVFRGLPQAVHRIQEHAACLHRLSFLPSPHPPRFNTHKTPPPRRILLWRGTWMIFGESLWKGLPLTVKWDKQKRAGSQDSISSWSSGGGTKLITSS